MARSPGSLNTILRNKFSVLSPSWNMVWQPPLWSKILCSSDLKAKSFIFTVLRLQRLETCCFCNAFRPFFLKLFLFIFRNQDFFSCLFRSQLYWSFLSGETHNGLNLLISLFLICNINLAKRPNNSCVTALTFYSLEIFLPDLSWALNLSLSSLEEKFLNTSRIQTFLF